MVLPALVLILLVIAGVAFQPPIWVMAIGAIAFVICFFCGD